MLTWKDDQHEQEPIVGEGLSERKRRELRDLRVQFQDVIQDSPGKTMLVQHSIETDAQPVRLPAYRIPHAHREDVRREIGEMLEEGIIEPTSSAWSAPIVLVKKKDKTLRLCVDYRRLNARSKADAYPMPRVDELIDRVGQSRYLSALDLSKGYWQVPIEEQSKPKTALITPFGLYQFKVMPFGLQGAPATFQRLMDLVLHGMEDLAAAYLDDIVIFSSSWENHLGHLNRIFESLRQVGLTVKLRNVS